MKNKIIKIYTTGYTGKDINELEGLLETLNAVLFDVRFSPNSRVPKWTKDNLQSLLKDKYHHILPFGNKTYREGKITIENLELGINLLEKQKTNVLLMCGCAELKECHRLVLTHELRRRGFEVEEIAAWKTTIPTLFLDFPMRKIQ